MLPVDDSQRWDQIRALRHLSSETRALVRRFTRTAFLAETTRATSAESLSRFGGVPWLPADEPLPICPACSQPLSLLVQLAEADCPRVGDRFPHNGLLQVFYCCTDTPRNPLCGLTAGAYRAWSAGSAVRFVSLSRPGTLRAPEGFHPLPERRIVSWRAIEEFPSFEELVGLIGSGARLEQSIDELYEASTHVPLAADKLLGWRAWIQGVNPPSCNRCGRQMEQLLQIEGAGNSAFEFAGSSSNGTVWQCISHTMLLTFSAQWVT